MHEIWGQRALALEELLPHLTKHVITVQRLQGEAYGMGRISNDKQQVVKKTRAARKTARRSLLAPSAEMQKTFSLMCFFNASSHANGCGALRRGTRPSGVQKRVKKSSNCFTTVTA